MQLGLWAELLASLLSEALAAVYRSVFLGLERNLCYAAAHCTGSVKECSGTLTGVLSCVAASLASLGLVYEALLCIEFLFAGGEYEISAAVLAL